LPFVRTLKFWGKSQGSAGRKGDGQDAGSFDNNIDNESNIEALNAKEVQKVFLL
jgi:hypothetical protein